MRFTRGDAICILDVNYDLQLAEIVYPTSSGFMHCWITNLQSEISDYYHFQWQNGSTNETVYGSSAGTDTIGTIYPREYATPLYQKDGRYALLYNTSKGDETKFGFVNYHNEFSFSGEAIGANDVYPVPNYPYSPNVVAKVDFDVRNGDGNVISGHEVYAGDALCILSVNYDLQLAEVVYPITNGYMHGWITNLQSRISDTYHFKWHNGSTSETVYGSSSGSDVIGSIDPYEYATPLYPKGNRYALLYNTSKGDETKFGFVNYHDNFNF